MIIIAILLVSATPIVWIGYKYGAVYGDDGETTPEPERPGIGNLRLPGTYTPEDVTRAKLPRDLRQSYRPPEDEF
jgi:hypothetical protein